MAGLKPHEIKIGTRTYYAKLPDRYDNGSTSNIGTALGIRKLGDNEEIDAEADTIEIGNAIKTGKLMRLRLTYTDPANENRTKNSNVICPISKAATAITVLLSKTYNGGNVVSAGVPRRRRLG